MHPRPIHGLPELVFIRRLVKGHPDLCPALKIDSQRNMVPEQNAQHAGDRKNQGKPEEEPLLPEPIDIRCTKQFQTHAQTLGGANEARNLSKSK
jgi:hypothetical protein